MSARARIFGVAAILAAVAASARQAGQPLKPGFNLFSKEQDIQLGQANAKQVLAQYQVVNNQFLQDYVRRVGGRLAETPEAKQSGFQFDFTVLNVGEINAFALPGGPMFIYTGLLKACESEAQLAGVMGHEMSHVILRHGTHEATKANLIQLPALLAGSVIGDTSVMGKLAGMGLGLGANSFVLKFSRDAESEADALGSHLMSEAGYNPIEMAHFFEKLATGSQPPQFLSDHPNPGNREKAIQAEVQTLPQRSYGYETKDFPRMKSELAMLPPPPKAPAIPQPQPGASAASGEWKQFQGQMFNVAYPNNWQVLGDPNASEITIAPQDGVVTRNSNTEIGYGAILSYFVPDNNRSDLRSATDDLIHHLHVDNPRLAATSKGRATRVGGTPGLLTTLSSSSPLGGDEADLLLTAMRPQGLFYIILIAPQSNAGQLQSTLQKIQDSIRFNQ
jgi:Zn-dependent protease with chaperone function